MKTLHSLTRNTPAISSTLKKLKSKLQLEHLDYDSLTHKKDVASRRLLLEKILGKKDASRFTDTDIDTLLQEIGFGVSTGFTSFEQFKSATTQCGNLCRENGSWVEKSGNDWLRFAESKLSERSEYRLSSGKICRATDSEYSSPLCVVFARTPPWLAKVLSNSDSFMVRKVAILLAKIFEDSTGFPVLAVNLHKETEHDMHLHIVYSEVKPYYKKLSKTKVKSIRRKLKEELRVELKSKSLPASNKHVAELYNQRGLESTIPDQEDQPTYKKVISFTRGGAPKKDWPYAKRNMHILGSAYRSKGWLWEAADSESKKEQVRVTREENPHRGSFTERFVKNANEAQDLYLDWWLEHQLYDLIYAELTPDRKSAVETHKAQSVLNYLQYGSSTIHPMEKALADDTAQLKEDEQQLAEDKSQFKQQTEEAMAMDVENTIEHILNIVDYEEGIDTRSDQLETLQTQINLKEQQLLDKTRALENEREQLESDKSAFQSQQSQANSSIATKEAQLEKQSEELALKRVFLKEKEAKLLAREESLTHSEYDAYLEDQYLTHRANVADARKEDLDRQQDKVTAFDLAKPIIDKILGVLSSAPKSAEWLMNKCKFPKGTFSKLAQAFGSKWTPPVKKEGVCGNCHKSPCECGGKTNSL